MPTRKSTRSKIIKEEIIEEQIQEVPEVYKKTAKKKASKKTSKKETESEPTLEKTIDIDYDRFRFIKITSGLDPRYVQILDKNINEKSTIKRLDKILENDKQSEKIAKGIFEATLLKCIENSPAPTIVLSIYDDICAKMVDNLNHKSKVGNYSLLMKVHANKFDPYEVPFMSPDEIFSENWELQKRKKAYVQAKQNEIEMTDAFTCHKCGEKKCKVQQMQTRAADEPMTNIITCTVCGNIFYK
jgi:DNA-directed RNA polymerase subunit M/transcription elongation factor TFIIS